MAWLAFLTLFGYPLLGLYFWHTRWRRTAMITITQIRFEQLIVAIILLVHACAIFPNILQADHLYFGAAEALSVIAWVALMSYWLASFFICLEGLQPILFFVSFLLIGLNLLLPSGHRIAVLATPLFKLHFTLAMLAYGLILYAVWLALFIWIADRQLHFSRGKHLLNRLPSLLTMEKYLFGSITLGFILLTFVLATGFSFMPTEYNQTFYFSHNVIFSLLSWLVFAILLWGRIFRGWRGRFAVNWVIAGFILLILGYIGTSFLLQDILPVPVYT